MSNVANARLNSFGRAPPEAVSPEDTILEIPLSELEMVLREAVEVFNVAVEMVRDAGVLRGRELARMTTRANESLKATRSPVEKLQLIFAYLKQLLAKIREALKTRPNESGIVINICSKIMDRAIRIIDYIKTTVQDDPKRKEIALDSQQCRILFRGVDGEPVSRKETIRAMRRAEIMWPELKCGHRPNDGRQTMRLTAKTEDLTSPPIIGSRDTWQRSPQKIGLCL